MVLPITPWLAMLPSISRLIACALAVCLLPSCFHNFVSVQRDGSVALDGFAVKDYLVQGNEYTRQKDEERRRLLASEDEKRRQRETIVPHTQ